MAVDPIQYFGPIDAIGKVCAAAQGIQAKGCDSHNYVRIGAAEEYRSAGVAGAGTPAIIPVTLGLEVESIGQAAAEIDQRGFCLQPHAEGEVGKKIVILSLVTKNLSEK